jgi:hypothetical protein
MLEDFISSLDSDTKLLLFKEAETFRATGTLPLSASIRQIAIDQFNYDGALNILEVCNQVYHYFALQYMASLVK